MYPSAVNSNPPRGWQILNLFGIPVHLEPGFLGLIGLIFFINYSGGNPNYAATGLWCFAIFFSILFHEIGHTAAAHASGCRDIRIALVMFGGYATHSPTTHGKSLVIVLAGPFFGLTLGCVFAFIHHYYLQPSALAAVALEGPRAAFRVFSYDMIFINIFWSLFNLLPMRPLDGGWAVQHTLSHWIKPQRANAWAARLSIMTCIPVGLIGMQAGIFIPIICLWCFMDNMRELQS